VQIRFGAPNSDVFVSRLFHKDVERRSTYARFQRLLERGFIDQAAARAIDDANPFARLGQAAQHS
jgi:hypothetical protein